MTGELTFPRPFSGIVRLMVMQLDLPFPNCRHLQFGWRLLDFTDRSDGHGLDRATLGGVKRAKRGSHEVATGADLMTGEQSRYLEVGDRVCWGVTTTDLGTVVGTSWSGVTIAWDDGHTTSIQHNDMAKVERVPVKV